VRLEKRWRERQEQAAEKAQISAEELKNRMAGAEAQIDIAEFSGPAEAVPLLQGVSRRVFRKP
jgi:hypothetical protein